MAEVIDGHVNDVISKTAIEQLNDTTNNNEIKTDIESGIATVMGKVAAIINTGLAVKGCVKLVYNPTDKLVTSCWIPPRPPTEKGNLQ